MQKLATNLAIVTSVLLSLPTAGRANGRPANSTGVFAKAGDPNKIILGTTFGVTFTSDGGRTWYWSCEAVIGGTSSVDNIPLWMADDSLVVGMPLGVYASSDMGCTWTAVGNYPAPQEVSDVVPHPTDGNMLVIASISPGDSTMVSQVQTTTDFGKTFKTIYSSSGQSQPTVWSIGFAPSDPNRIYLGAWLMETPLGAVVLRSDNGGQSWQTFTINLPFNAQYAFEPVIKVSPADANTFVVAVQNSANEQSTIFRSTDGGQTISNMATMQQPFRRFAFSADGKTVLASGIQNIYRSTDGGQTFDKLPKPASNACVAAADNTFYSCGGAFTGDPNNPASVVDCYALASSSDNGGTWLPIMNLADVKGPANCPASSEETTQCLQDWPNQKAADATYVLGPWTGPCASPNVLDPNNLPSKTPTPGAAKGGCSCAGGPGGASDSLFLLVSCGAMLLRRRRRARVESLG